MLSLQYSISGEDYVKYCTYVLWDAPEKRKKRILYYIRQLIPVFLFILAFYYTGIFERNNRFILLIIGLISITSVLSLTSARSNVIRQAKNIANDPANLSIFREILLTVSEIGITTKNEWIETRFQWKSIIKKLESKDYYFLYTSLIQALIIPKRILNQEEKIQFEKYLAQNLSFDAEIGHLVKS